MVGKPVRKTRLTQKTIKQVVIPLYDVTGKLVTIIRGDEPSPEWLDEIIKSIVLGDKNDENKKKSTGR